METIVVESLGNFINAIFDLDLSTLPWSEKRINVDYFGNLPFGLGIGDF